MTNSVGIFGILTLLVMQPLSSSRTFGSGRGLATAAGSRSLWLFRSSTSFCCTWSPSSAGRRLMALPTSRNASS